MPGGQVSLAPGEQAVEVRAVALDPQTCMATMEEGVPPADARETPDDSEMSSDSGGAGPAGKLAAAAARRRHRRRATAAATYRSAGYVTTWWEDPFNIDVTRVHVTIDYYYNYSCTWNNLATWQEHWYSTSGWSRTGHDWGYADRCDLAASSDYAQFKNGTFCAGGDVWSTYDRTSIHGHADGSLYAFWNSWVSGAICRNLLSFNHKLVRTV